MCHPPHARLCPTPQITTSLTKALILPYPTTLPQLPSIRSAPAVYEHVKRLALPKPLPVVCYNGASCRIFPAATTDPSGEQVTGSPWFWLGVAVRTNIAWHHFIILSSLQPSLVPSNYVFTISTRSCASNSPLISPTTHQHNLG